MLMDPYILSVRKADKPSNFKPWFVLFFEMCFLIDVFILFINFSSTYKPQFGKH